MSSADPCACFCDGIRHMSAASAAPQIEKHLKKVSSKKKSWNELYQCVHCATYWEMTYPGAGDVCCVEPELSRLSREAAAEAYPL